MTDAFESFERNDEFVVDVDVEEDEVVFLVEAFKSHFINFFVLLFYKLNSFRQQFLFETIPDCISFQDKLYPHQAIRMQIFCRISIQCKEI